jgi:adenylylsulfate kinase
MARVIWITGLPGCGKSVVAEALRVRHPAFVVLRMDDLRAIVTPAPDYSPAERELVYRALVYTATVLVGLDRDVIIDATGNLRRWRELARGLIPGFSEVYLACGIDVCMRREQARRQMHGAPEKIYEKARAGMPVPGVNAPYEAPLRAEVEVDADALSVEEIVETIEKRLGFLSVNP